MSHKPQKQALKQYSASLLAQQEVLLRFIAEQGLLNVFNVFLSEQPDPRPADANGQFLYDVASQASEVLELTINKAQKALNFSLISASDYYTSTSVHGRDLSAVKCLMHVALEQASQEYKLLAPTTELKTCVRELKNHL